MLPYLICRLTTLPWDLSVLTNLKELDLSMNLYTQVVVHLVSRMRLRSYTSAYVVTQISLDSFTHIFSLSYAFAHASSLAACVMELVKARFLTKVL